MPTSVAREALLRLARDLAAASAPMDLQLRVGASWLHPAVRPGESPPDHEICLRFDDELTLRYRVVDAEPLEPQLARLADRIQDDIVDELVRLWPRCPGHAHAATAELRAETAVWVCPANGHVLARVGALRGA
jgi:hypothetical protein